MTIATDTAAGPLRLTPERARAWLLEQHDALAAYRESGHLTLAQEVERDGRLLRLLFDAGLSRYGWPESAGGAGGGERERAVLYDALAQAGITQPEAFVLLETLGPVLVRYAPELAARHLPAYLRGEELWGQGFSEPDAGSDLAAVRTRATPAPGGFRLTGSKVWTTLGQCAQWAMVLCRTDASVAGHRGLSMLWVDLAAPGVEVRPIRAGNGRNEFAEMSFEDVFVPESGLIGELGGGWGVAMYLLQFERGMYAWGRQADLHRALREGLATADTSAEPSPTALVAAGAAFAALSALRARSAVTVRRLAAGETLGPEASIDKILLSRAEQHVYDALRLLAPDRFVLGTDPAAHALRDRWFYSRVTSIFGGAVEIQRGIVAERLLQLPREPRSGR